MHIYRYRSNNLLSQKGLLYDEWYFASREELNDPIDMQSKFEFGENSQDTWLGILSSTWQDKEYITLVSQYFTSLSPISYEQLLQELDTHALKLIGLIFKNRKISNAEFESFSHSMNNVRRLLELYEPGAGYSVSFSKKNDEMLMWSHYAGSHTGYCLIYRPIDGYLGQCPLRTKESLDVSESHSSTIGSRFKVEDIHYENQLNSIDARKLLPTSKTGFIFANEDDRLEHHAHIQKQILTKNTCWEYEAECRLLLPQPNKWISGHCNYNSYQRLFHYDFNQITGIIFGARMSPNDETTLKTIINAKLKKRYSDISASQEKKYIFDFVFQKAKICTSSRNLKIVDLELNSMGTPISPGNDYYNLRMEKWRNFEGMSVEAGQFSYGPIP